MSGSSMNLPGGTPHAMSVRSANLRTFTSSLPSSSNSVVNNLLNDYTPNIKSNPFQSANSLKKISCFAPSNLSQNVGFGQSAPELASQHNDWRDSIKQELRNHMVDKLMKALFPSPDPTAIHDPRVRQLIFYTRNAEKEMFEQAVVKEAYYHLLTEKIDVIQKEVQKIHKKKTAN